MEDEWELFQKSVKEQTVVSNVVDSNMIDYKCSNLNAVHSVRIVSTLTCFKLKYLTVANHIKIFMISKKGTS